MPKPPRSTPHSDLDGVREDEGNRIAEAERAGQDAGDLDRARRDSAGRPPDADDRPARGGRGG
jgi:hypothetical protein